MSLYTELQAFYSDVQECVSGRNANQFAWNLIELTIESTQDGGTYFSIEPWPRVKVDRARLQAVLEKYEMDYVEVEAKT